MSSHTSSTLSVASLLLLTTALALGGCTAAAGEPEVETSEGALISNGGLGYTPDCADGFCTCTGDVDCNDMFSSGVCGEKAICQINANDVPRCRCAQALTTGGGGRKGAIFRAPGGLAATVR
ncbi:MAG: hypothetical protein JWP87_3311 [Labilithrix sp.]|nr:hypothetical protein [Labilithrix sp.]